VPSGGFWETSNGNCLLKASIVPLQTFVILPKEKTAVWVKQNVNFFQQNGAVIKIEQN
jgi:hypothetical protein